MKEEVLDKIKELIRSKMPLISKEKLESVINTSVNGIRQHLIDYKKFNSLIDTLIGDSSFKFRVDSFITVVRKNQGENSENQKPNRTDFEPYKRVFVLTTFFIKNEDPPDLERINFELSKYSKFLANTRLIDYKASDGNYLKRFLTRSEYQEISNFRESSGLGKLREYSEIKFFDQNIKPNEDKLSEVVGFLVDKMNVKNEKSEYDDSQISSEAEKYLEGV